MISFTARMLVLAVLFRAVLFRAVLVMAVRGLLLEVELAQGESPAGRQTLFAEGLTFIYHDADATLAAQLWPLMIADRARIMERLQLFPPGTVRVYLAPTREDYARAHGGAAPQGALGLYFSATRTVLLRSPRTLATGEWDVRGVLRHELAHGVLDLAIEGPLPRWLHEGLAILMADELSFLDDSHLTWLAFQGRLLPLQLLVEGFPRSEAGLEQAYSQAASFARFLLRRERARGLQRLVGLLSEGAALNVALVSTYGAALPELEQEWQAALAGRFSWLVWVTPLSMLGGMGAPLALVAYLRRRWQIRKRYREWEVEEAREAAAADHDLLLNGEPAPRPLRQGHAPSHWLN